MKVLLDTCVAKAALGVLERAGHEVAWAGSWDEDPGDEEILRQAVSDGRVLVTLDKDFGELAIVHRRPHRGIVRLVGLTASEQGAACLDVLLRHAELLGASGIVTVERSRVRIRPAD